MTPWVILSGLAGGIIGAFLKWLADLHTAKRTRLLDERVKQAIAFLGAADKVRRTAQDRHVAAVSLETQKQAGKPHDRLEFDYEKRLADNRDAVTAAEDAYNAIRLLLPKTASAARTYLYKCANANVTEDDDHAGRERARKSVEQAIQKELGA